MIVLAWLTCSIFVGMVAMMKDRSFLGWFLLSVLFSPILVILGLIAVPVKSNPQT